jgi:translation initiation factor IF-2
MRVFELAKQIRMTSKQLQQELAKMGIKVKNHMSTLEEADIQAITRKLKPQPPTPSSTISSQSKKSTPSSGAKRRGGTVTAPSAPAAPLKRSHLLIKKRVVVETVKSEPQFKPQVPSVVAEAVPLGQVENPLVNSPQAVASPGSVGPVGEVVTPPGALTPGEKPKEGEKAEQTAEEKKKAEKPLDLWKLEKKEGPLKFKEKVKKTKKSKWVQGGETFDFKQELTRMQDFRPFHRRDDRMRGGTKKGQGGGVAEVTKPRKKVIKLSPGVTVKEFSEILER